MRIDCVDMAAIAVMPSLNPFSGPARQVAAPAGVRGIAGAYKRTNVQLTNVQLGNQRISTV